MSIPNTLAFARNINLTNTTLSRRLLLHCAPPPHPPPPNKRQLDGPDPLWVGALRWGRRRKRDRSTQIYPVSCLSDVLVADFQFHFMIQITVETGYRVNLD